MKKLGIALLVALASVSVYIGAQACISEVRTYQALKGEHLAMLKFLGEQVGSSKDKDGKVVPITRADVLSAVVNSTLQAAQKAAAPAPAAQ